MRAVEDLIAYLEGRVSYRDLYVKYVEREKYLNVEELLRAVILRVSELTGLSPRRDFPVPPLGGDDVLVPRTVPERISTEAVRKCLDYRRHVNFLGCLLSLLAREEKSVGAVISRLGKILTLPLFLTDVLEVAGDGRQKRVSERSSQNT